MTTEEICHQVLSGKITDIIIQVNKAKNMLAHENYLQAAVSLETITQLVKFTEFEMNIYNSLGGSKE